ncbi:MAG: DUF1570 domain-containing protein [Phycisphaeraceae bacterium]|nr:DUF1570 domain-containing protein [Phycisphaeraceae bacterium]
MVRRSPALPGTSARIVRRGRGAGRASGTIVPAARDRSVRALRIVRVRAFMPMLLLLLMLLSPAAGGPVVQAADPAARAARVQGTAGGPSALGSAAGWWQRSWVETSRYYTIRAAMDRAVAASWGRHLDRMYEEYQARMADLRPRTPEKLNVFIFEDRDAYVETLRIRFGIDARGTGGMFFATRQGEGLAFWTADLPRRRIEHVIQHEGFHQFAYSRFGQDLPIWVNEGLAEFFGESVLLGEHFVIGQSRPHVVDAVRSAVREDRHIPFARLLEMTPQEWSRKVALGDADADLLYRQAWSIVSFLVYGDDGRYQPAFDRYLRLLNSALPPHEAFTRVFGEDIDAFEASWKRHALSARPSAFLVAMERLEFLAAGAGELALRGLRPDSLESLQRELRGIDFTYVMESHDRRRILRASDDANFEIPMDDLSVGAPVFTLHARTPVARTTRELEAERRWPTPAEIRTKGLRPLEIRVAWRRDHESGRLSFDLVGPTR